MTIIGDALVVTLGDHSKVVEKAITEVEAKVRSRCRRKLPGLRVRGVHEIDVIAPAVGHLGAHKVQTLARLGIDLSAVRADQRVLLVHLHCLIDCGQHLPDKVAEELRAEFPGSRRIMGKPLEAGRSVLENVARLASYSAKLKVAYCTAWGGVQTKYHELYEPEWVETMRQTLGTIGLDRLLFLHGDLVAGDLTNH
jgi:hypothetical protein